MYSFVIVNCNSTSKGILVYVYSGMYNVYVEKKRKIFIITKIVHMNEKTRLSSEKEKVKESQLRSVAPPLDTHIGRWVRGVTRHAYRDTVAATYSLQILRPRLGR